MKEFQDFSQDDLQKVKVDLRNKLAQGEFIMLSSYIYSYSNERLQEEFVSKISENLLPTDHTQEKNKHFLRAVFAQEGLGGISSLLSMFG